MMEPMLTKCNKCYNVCRCKLNFLRDLAFEMNVYMKDVIKHAQLAKPFGYGKDYISKCKGCQKIDLKYNNCILTMSYNIITVLGRTDQPCSQCNEACRCQRRTLREALIEIHNHITDVLNNFAVTNPFGYGKTIVSKCKPCQMKYLKHVNSLLTISYRITSEIDVFDNTADIECKRNGTRKKFDIDDTSTDDLFNIEAKTPVADINAILSDSESLFKIPPIEGSDMTVEPVDMKLFKRPKPTFIKPKLKRHLKK